eukprot:m.404977 g.404977  ORF g.404977 m.404977 type:complete len:164 (-) comp21203_c0_seq4:908-1399(-)
MLSPSHIQLATICTRRRAGIHQSERVVWRAGNNTGHFTRSGSRTCNMELPSTEDMENTDTEEYIDDMGTLHVDDTDEAHAAGKTNEIRGRHNPTADTPVTVHMTGTFSLKESLVLNANDSHTMWTKETDRNAPAPVLIGGIALPPHLWTSVSPSPCNRVESQT